MLPHPQSPEEVQQIKAQLWDDGFPPQQLNVALAPAPPRAVVVAEGDSWFDYFPGLDILDHLKGDHRYRVIKHASAGDTLVNMAWGTDTDPRFSFKPPQLPQVLESIDREQPTFFLISGGGNDISGEDGRHFAAFLNHRESGLPPFRTSYADGVVAMFERAYVHIIENALHRKDDLHILLHGYAYPVPNGTRVFNFGPFQFGGPWLRPALARNRLDFSTEGRAALRELIDMFNVMLSRLEDRFDGRVHRIDLRGFINDADWVNELHLTNAAYRRVANEYDALMRQLL